MDKAEFTKRVLAMESRLYRVSMSMLFDEADACDAVQEAVAKAYLKKDSLRAEKYFETWLTRILINACRDVQRGRRDEPEPYENTAAPTTDIETRMDIDAALKQLPEKYRLPLVMRYYKMYTLSEISTILQLPEALIKSRLHQGRKALKMMLGGDYLEG